MTLTPSKEEDKRRFPQVMQNAIESVGILIDPLEGPSTKNYKLVHMKFHTKHVP
jgi:hypothetical protein